MTLPATKPPTRPDSQRFPHQVGRQESRKLEARRDLHRSVWFGLGMFGLVGWSVSVPVLGCVALGVWIDGRHPGRISWTLTLLFIGVVLGCLNAWYWIRRESGRN